MPRLGRGGQWLLEPTSLFWVGKPRLRVTWWQRWGSWASDEAATTLTKGLQPQNTLGTRELDPGVATSALKPRLGWARFNQERERECV